MIEQTPKPPSPAAAAAYQATAPEGPRVSGPAPGAPAEPMVLQRIQRGETAMRTFESRWRELWAMFDGDQWVERVAADNSVQRIESREGGSKPRWVPRLTRNRFTKAISGEVSVVCSRTPSFEVAPGNGDRAKVNQARLGEKILLSLHESLQLRSIVYETGLNSAVTGNGFVWPYFNPSLGEIGPDGPMGEIEVGKLRQDQVIWEPGAKFEDSRWYAVRLAKPVTQVTASKAYRGPKVLKADAQAALMENQNGGGAAELVFYYHYLERPSSEHPTGRWMQLANRTIVAESYPYPCKHDVPVIHRLRWIPRPHRDRDIGVGELAIDIQRSINRIVNQLIAWRNLVLNPQLLAPRGSQVTQNTSKPGQVVEYKPVGGREPKWREVPEIPASLFRELEQAYADLDYVIGGNSALPPGVEAGSAIQGFNEREMQFRSMVVGHLADFWSSLGRHLLYLVQQHYTEERLVTVNGRFGVDMIADFLGEQIDGLSAVSVKEASIEPRTRAAQEAKILAFADKGWIPPHLAMAALQGGTADAILDRFELDVAKAHRNIRALEELGRAVTDLSGIAGVPDHMLPQAPQAGPMDQPGPHIEVLSDWMKTLDFERQPPTVQEAALALLEQFQTMVALQQMTAADQQTQAAEQAGMQNAALPQDGPKPEPSRPSVAHEAAALGA